ncbi:metal-dependent transcriptional regulator [Flavobacteriaceae bacterium]|nr:metal-dependent transcriptional regulator [Flavobacteriaceae bacterium]
MPTITHENYLKAMFALEDRGQVISLTALSKQLEVSIPTINAMVKKMENRGWVSYTKYQPLELTESGRKEAAAIVRKHRLSEMYLEKMMGFGWEEVHDIAEELEHISDSKLFDRMDELLGFPTHDPHGSPIPDKDGQLQKNTFKKLAELKPNDQGVLKGLRNSSTEFLMYLNSKDIHLGLLIKILHVEAFDQTMKIEFKNEVGELVTTYISKEVSSRLLLEPI